MHLSFRPFSFLLVGCFVLILALPAAAQSSQCPVTQPSASRFQVPEGFPAPQNPFAFYHGTPELWVLLTPGPWSELPIWDVGMKQKVVWYTKLYSRWAQMSGAEPLPKLEIEGRRLDGNAPLLYVEGANPSHAPGMGYFIMSGVNFPTSGCWEVTGRLGNATTTFVVEIGESHHYGPNGQPIQTQGE